MLSPAPPAPFGEAKVKRTCYLAVAMIGFQRFDPELFRRKLMQYSDAELTKMGKAMCPAAQRWKDPASIADMAAKYKLCKEEWLRRHPKQAY
jgi:hypothetical protein